jgi:hypothetical protein
MNTVSCRWRCRARGGDCPWVENIGGPSENGGSLCWVEGRNRIIVHMKVIRKVTGVIRNRYFNVWVIGEWKGSLLCWDVGVG